jgi:hypothetical protein
MSMISKAEQEVNRARLKIYEETKNITPAQYKERLDKLTEANAKKYGFKVVVSISDISGTSEPNRKNLLDDRDDLICFSSM